MHVRGLVKSYSGVRAVNGIDLDIRRGEIFALLGPNGAGKTTTVEILEGYRTRDSGEVTVLGYDPGRQRAPLKRKIGIVLQSTGVEPYLTVAETVRMYAGFYPHPRPVDEVIGLVGLEEKRNSRVNKLSGGQQRSPTHGSTRASTIPATPSSGRSSARARPMGWTRSRTTSRPPLGH